MARLPFSMGTIGSIVDRSGSAGRLSGDKSQHHAPGVTDGATESHSRIEIAERGALARYVTTGVRIAVPPCLDPLNQAAMFW